MNYLKNFLPYLFGFKKGNSYKLPHDLDWGSLSFEELLMFHALKGTFEDFLAEITLSSLSLQERFLLLTYQDYFTEKFHLDFKTNYPEDYLTFQKARQAKALRANEVQALLNHQSDELMLIALLNPNRMIPGRFFMKTPSGKFVEDGEGKIWSLAVLATSSRGLDFCYRNGQTPCGVYTIDSVMPEANNQKEFGKNRRLILNFIERSEGESRLKSHFPDEHHQLDYWLQSVVARELGRDHLRIHGTGTLNNKFYLPYFPMVPSSGCLTLKERSFGPLAAYNDQRILLDTMLKNLGEEVSYQRETNIRELLYVVEFDGKYQELKF